MCLDDSQAALIAQAVAGDRACLSQLLLIHHDALKQHIASRITPDLQGLITAEDVLHQTFVRAAGAIGQFQPRHENSFRAWLETIAGNLVRDAAKRRRRERRSGPFGPIGHTAGDDSSVAAIIDRIAGDTTTPGRRIQRQESIRRMRAALATLPDDQREAIHRYYLQGESHEQIALATGRTRDAVRGLCYRARKNLRALMGGSSLYFSG
jgi:RNA polymerase sigma-70 factor (ECF subfamily)